MTLSSPQRRALAAIDRDLSGDPTLSALLTLFSEAPPQIPRRTAPPPPPAPAPRRSLGTAITAAAAVILGAGGALAAGLFGIPALVAAGVTLSVIAMVVLVADLLGAHRAAPVPVPTAPV